MRLFRPGGGNIWYKKNFGKLPDGAPGFKNVRVQPSDSSKNQDLSNRLDND
jgi:hypothetical protein